MSFSLHSARVTLIVKIVACPQRLDVGFVLDASGSVGKDNFQMQVGMTIIKHLTVYNMLLGDQLKYF